jgi:transglutaminase-like putative cysteine protease
MQVKVGCEMVYESDSPTPMVVLTRPQLEYTTHRLLSETRFLNPDIPVSEYVDTFGNHLWRFVAPVGRLQVYYDALAQIRPTPDPVWSTLPGTAVENLPDEVLVYLLPSRHCQSDLVIWEAWELFGSTNWGWERVQAVCDWIHVNISYGTGSTLSTSGYDAYRARRGVCRDFAHIAVMLCRALSIPARYMCGYLPDIDVPVNPTPMDFHAWFEVFLDGSWHTFDARHNIPRLGRVVIGCGRDAVDVALVTSYGSSNLVTIKVWADEVKTTQAAAF